MLFRTHLRDSLVMKYLTMALLSSIMIIVYWFEVGRIDRIGDFSRINELQETIRGTQLVSISALAAVIFAAYVLGVRGSFKDRKRDQAGISISGAAILATLGGLYTSTAVLMTDHFPSAEVGISGYVAAAVPIALSTVLLILGVDDKNRSARGNIKRMLIGGGAIAAHMLLVSFIGYVSCWDLMTLR